MAETESKTYQILANILLAIGAIICIVAICLVPSNQSNAPLLILLIVVALAIGTRFSRVCIYLLGLADIAVAWRFFG